MNVSLAQDLSVYQLALGVKSPPQALSLSPATLLSLVRSQIDLLIEQQITATLWVKLPPQKIWQSELGRYHSWVGAKGVVYSCYVGESRHIEESKNENLSRFSFFPYDIGVQILPDSQLRREYFFMVLSPEFCSLILAHRSRQKDKINTSLTVKPNKNPALQAINTVEGRIIQQVLNGIKQATAPDSLLIVPADFVCPTVPKAELLSSLLFKQLQRQEEINRKIAFERLGKAQQQNQKLQKKEQLKDEYLSSVCQELRTPLTHTKTALSLLNSPNLKIPQRQRYLQMLSSLCDRQNSLITGLLDLVDLERNLEKTNLESVQLADIVPGVVSTYQPVTQEKDIILSCTIPNDLPAVKCVSGIKQIVINLLHNSIKFTPNGGQVSVRAFVGGTWMREGFQKKNTQTRDKSTYVFLEFSDTGIGIAENEIPKIFERFYRVRPTAGEDTSGAGLGLTIVQQLLRRCGGSISVKSKLNEGSIFTVQLAIAPEVRE